MTDAGYRFFTDCRHHPKKYMQLEILVMTSIQPVNMTVAQKPVKDAALLDAAQRLEASFLAEMLKSAGLGSSSSEFGGGAGEDQFSSFLIQEQAMQMVRAGGIGLTESLFNSLKDRADG
jgi:Rod binding domain-containing protein